MGRSRVSAATKTKRASQHETGGKSNRVEWWKAVDVARGES